MPKLPYHPLVLGRDPCSLLRLVSGSSFSQVGPRVGLGVAAVHLSTVIAKDCTVTIEDRINHRTAMHD